MSKTLIAVGAVVLLAGAGALTYAAVGTGSGIAAEGGEKAGHSCSACAH